MMQGKLNSIEEMAENITKHRNKSGYTQKLYKAQSDTHKGEELAKAIWNKRAALETISKRESVDFLNLEQVQQRTLDYLDACIIAENYPSFMGLATEGYGISRQALNQYLLAHNNPVTDYIRIVKDSIADILTNASLYNNANAIAVIFQLKNHFEHADRIEVRAISSNMLGDLPTAEEIEKIEMRLLEGVCTD